MYDHCRLVVACFPTPTFLHTHTFKTDDLSVGISSSRRLSLSISGRTFADPRASSNKIRLLPSDVPSPASESDWTQWNLSEMHRLAQLVLRLEASAALPATVEIWCSSDHNRVRTCSTLDSRERRQTFPFFAAASQIQIAESSHCRDLHMHCVQFAVDKSMRVMRLLNEMACCVDAR